nr:integrase, catalytic region, zinc finger, CCHC-type, peptidase aspartic, catalytic [Tanacetum cinerariifolium]
MIASNKSQYIADVKVMNYLLQAIPNDIYNSVDACKIAKEIWERIKRLMFGSDVTSHVRHSRLMDEFNKFAAKEVVDYEDEYQWKLQGDSQEDKLTSTMMLLARVITKKFSILTNNSLRTSSNTKNQSVIQDGRVDIQTKNEGYGGNGNKNAGRRNRNQAFNTRTNERNQIKPRVRDAKYFREQILLAIKDEAKSNLKNKENDFLLDNSFGEETMEELTDLVMLMARIQPSDGNDETVPSYDAKTVSEVNASSKFNEQVNNVKRIESSNSVRRQKSKATKSKDRLLKSKIDKRPFAHVRKMSSSVKRSLFTTHIAVKSKNLRATSAVVKSRLSLAETPTAINKVIPLVLWIVNSGCSKHMTSNLQLPKNFVEKFIGTIRFRNDRFAAITGYGVYV